MVWSVNLQRHIRVPIEQLNKFCEAELDSAIGALPGSPDTRPEEIHKAAARGDLNAKLVIQRAEEGNQIALDWL